MRKITELTPDLVGKRIKCIIEHTPVKDAKIQFEREKYYICQNKQKGQPCKDKLGYEYSWVCNSGTASALNEIGVKVTDIYLLDEPETGTPISAEEEKKQPIQLININKKQFLKINQND